VTITDILTLAIFLPILVLLFVGKNRDWTFLFNFGKNRTKIFPTVPVTSRQKVKTTFEPWKFKLLQGMLKISIDSRVVFLIYRIGGGR
jgi:hypothetical protein